MKEILNRLSLHLILKMLLLGCNVFVFSSVSAEEHEDTQERSRPDDVENKPKFVESEDSKSMLRRQFKTAEIADAVMGTDTQIDPLDIKSFYLMNMRDPDSPFSESTQQSDHPEITSPNSHNTTKSYKVNCAKRNITGLESFFVEVLNSSQDLMELLNGNSTECSVVMFFTTWCPFSAKLAPHFNALPRVFPLMHFFALDAFQHSSISTRFGTVAVPNILLFQGSKPMARFNHTERTLTTLTAFICNQTGLEGDPNINVTDADLIGPIPTVPVKTIDWILVFSTLFVSVFTLYAILRTDSIRWLIPGQEHEHQE